MLKLKNAKAKILFDPDRIHYVFFPDTGICTTNHYYDAIV